MMVWSDGLGRVMGLRLAPGGPPLDAAPFEVAWVVARIDTVRAGWDGARWVVIWRESPDDSALNASELRGRYLDRAGAAQSDVFTIARQVIWDDAPALACLPTGTCLVAYASLDRASAAPRDVHLVRLSAPLPPAEADAGACDGGGGGTLAGGAGCRCQSGRRASGPGAAVVVVAMVGALFGRRRGRAVRVRGKP